MRGGVMRPDRLIKMGLALVMAAGIAHAGRAWGDDGHSGNARVPSYFVYPRGRTIAQVYAKPAEGTGNLQAFVASPGAMNPSAPMSVLSQQPSARRLLQRQGMVFLPRTATR